MSESVVYERDLLYPTENILKPGSIHVKILSHAKNGKIPVVIENKTENSPLDYLDSIIKVMQSEIFERINIDIKDNTDLYVKSEIIKDYKYAKILFSGDKTEIIGTDSIEE